VVLDLEHVVARSHGEECPVAQTAERSAMTAKTPSSVEPGGAGGDRPSPEQRAASGKTARAKVPLEAHAEFRPARKRDPVALLLRQAETRRPELVPIRHGPDVGVAIRVLPGRSTGHGRGPPHHPDAGSANQLCGDAHLSNFGAYASPERRLVFDINDFDETLPGPFEWDVKRLAASFVVAGRDNGLRRKERRKATLTAVERYRTAMRASRPRKPCSQKRARGTACRRSGS
jgi:hypothetical protein